MTRDEIAQLQSRPPRTFRDRALLLVIYSSGPALYAVIAWWWLR